ncbi:MAG: ADP-ribose diphosphatase [SAR86 cluster bacterium]|uniref:ADP-ribose pyrophosphatase n=1 Tax=SAR86 cluster bacterium TaxID=2030880 RepID=A0A2A4MS69_9GAMM|nr:MAG: ADP-ribose diphosphatase [SAR86 cluster bacterium]
MPTTEPVFDQQDVQISAEQTLYSGFMKLQRLTLKHRLFGGGWSALIERELIVKEAAVGVLLFDPQRDELVLVRQFRVGMIDTQQSPWLLELVAGMVDKGESLAEVAKRESREEANCEPSQLMPICEYYNSPGSSNEKIALFCGKVDASGQGGVFGLVDEHEDISVEVISYQHAIAELNLGKINNAMTVIALQWLQLNKQKLVQQWL